MAITAEQLQGQLDKAVRQMRDEMQAAITAETSPITAHIVNVDAQLQEIQKAFGRGEATIKE